MKNIAEWIDGIIQDLVSTDKKLKDTLLKVQVLAFKLENKQLKEWVECEMNGYKGIELPDYRIIPSAVYGNLMQNRGFGQMLTRNNNALPIEFLDKDTREMLQKLEMNLSVSELEKMASDDKEYSVNIPHIIQLEITRKLANGWQVDAAWQVLSKNSIEGILSSIKSNLIKFLLELNQEIGNDGNYSIMENKKDVDKLFDQTIGKISGKTVNINFGDNTQQNVSTGDSANINYSQGDGNHQIIESSMIDEIKEVIESIQTHIDNINLKANDKNDVLDEIKRLESQISRSEPKTKIVNSALSTIQGILLGVTGNALTPVILEKLGLLLSRF
jgi:hypothetical protein